MSKLIAIDDGHGMETAGKRTPIFPATGKFMHENEFNRATADRLKTNMERCGFRTLMVAPGDADTPLRVRTNTANDAKADFFQSIHANADTGTWGKACGIDTFHYPGSVEGTKAATIIQKHLIQGTLFKNRGIQEANFHVLRETHMPSVLCECGFMDNMHDAQLLLTDAYRNECADEIAQGICEYFGVTWVPANEMTFEQAIDILSKKAGISPAYWKTKNNIDPYFAALMNKITTAWK
ncbi:MAG: N-acetylmuramoyl-L-alanine amidase [Candidatus Paceibacterota bacterium]|jgi:N-acetylmuramoyl-L-alanine amidase